MVEVIARYEGGLHCQVHHGPSGAEFGTDAPTDNHGKGEAFSPTDLVGAGIAACTLTIMAISAESHGIDLRGATAVTRKEMSTDAPRRIVRLSTMITLPLSADHPKRPMLEQAARGCPVHKSISAEIDAPIEFTWAGEPAARGAAAPARP